MTWHDIVKIVKKKITVGWFVSIQLMNFKNKNYLAHKGTIILQSEINVRLCNWK